MTAYLYRLSAVFFSLHVLKLCHVLFEHSIINYFSRKVYIRTQSNMSIPIFPVDPSMSLPKKTRQKHTARCVCYHSDLETLPPSHDFQVANPLPVVEKQGPKALHRKQQEKQTAKAMPHPCHGAHSWFMNPNIWEFDWAKTMTNRWLGTSK